MAQIETNLDEAIKAFKAIQLSDTEFEAAIRKIARNVMLTARRELINAGRRGLMKNGDPHKAIEAVKSSVYKRIIGGNLSILQKRNRSGKVYPLPPSRRENQRSDRTANLLSYYGADRGFILRFLNSGTARRVVRNFNNQAIKRQSIDERQRRRGDYKSGTIGYRGHIEPRNWFGDAAHKAIKNASDHMAKLIEQEIKRYLDGINR